MTIDPANSFENEGEDEAEGVDARAFFLRLELDRMSR